MGKKDVSIQVDNLDRIFSSIEIELNDYTTKIGKELSKIIANEIELEYRYMIDEFYNEYTPTSYKRHEDRDMERGYYKTYRRLNTVVHGSTFIAGIVISNRDMYKDYSEGSLSALSSFIAGYHGDPKLGIESSINIIPHMQTYIESLKAYAISDFLIDVKSVVKKNNKYKYLKI